MKKMKLAALSVALMVLSSAFFGCDYFRFGVEESSNPSSELSSAVSEAPSSSSSGLPEVSSDSSDLQSGDFISPILTDDPEFNKVFAANPIDQAYKTDSGNAFSNVDMIAVANNYSIIWQGEIDYAYKHLLEKALEADKAALKDEQALWVENTPASLEDIAKEAQSVGGSLAQVVSATDEMEYYRLRCASIYRALYNYEKDFSFHFSAKG